MNNDTADGPRPVSLAYADAADPAGPLLHFLGYLGIFYALFGLFKVFDGLANDSFAPRWLMNVTYFVHYPREANLRKNFLGFYFDLQAAIEPLLCIFLFAGSIGCVRRYSRTRRWLKLYGILSIANALVIVAMITVPLAFRRGWQWSTAWIVYTAAGRAVVDCTLPIVLLWLVRRQDARQALERR
ncbi:MAG TPA: hypothetical protein VF624_10285 [Tepidisphaeraceae bacterium]